MSEENKNLKDFNVNRIFTYHAPTKDQVARYQDIRDTAKELAFVIMAASPHSRERSLALTNLQQAVMWANAAIAINEKSADDL